MFPPKPPGVEPSLYFPASGSCQAFAGLWQHNASLSLCLHMAIFLVCLSLHGVLISDEDLLRALLL